MAMKGTLTADFDSFFAAVQKAQIELEGFESDANKVEDRLNRMSNAFQGNKIIQQATLTAEAVERIGGASKLTASEQEKVNRVVSEAIEKYKALGQTAPKALTDLADATKKTETQTSSFADEFKGMFAGMLSAQAVIDGFKSAWAALVAFIGSSLQSFASAEAAEKKVRVALDNIGAGTPEAVAQMNELAGSFQNTTKYSDDLINEMEALLIQVGQVTPAEMQKALTAATDLASGLGIDLKDATTAVAKAFEGEIGGLKKYGIAIDEAKFKAEGMPAVLDAIQQRFGGQAAAELETYSGSLANLENAWDNVKESIGKAVALNPIMQAFLNNMKTGADGAQLSVDDLDHSWSNFVGHMGASNLANAIRSLEDYAKRQNEAAQLTRETAKAHEDAANFMAKVDADLAARAAATARETARQKKQAEDDAAKQREQAAKDAQRAMEAEAAKLKALQDEIYGKDVIEKAKNYVAAVGDIAKITSATAEQQGKVNAAVYAGIEAYKRLGETAPQSMNAVFWATMQTPPVVAGLDSSFKSLGETVQTGGAAMVAAAQAAAAEWQRWNDEQWQINQEAIDRLQALEEAQDAAKKKTEEQTAANHQLAESYQVVYRSASDYLRLAAQAELDSQRNLQRGGIAATYGMFQSQQAASYREQAGYQAYYEDQIAARTGTGAAWGNRTLNVNVNGTTAQDRSDGRTIGQRIVGEMKSQGLRF